MQQKNVPQWMQEIKLICQSFSGAIIFYTIIPLPQKWQFLCQRIARWSPFIGMLIGFLGSLFDIALAYLQIPLLTRSAVIVAVWVFLTGGLHLDGVIDTADGLAVSNPERRLAVMQDSVTGAFGVMAAVIVLLLKTAALSDLQNYRALGLIEVAAWGRWGQVMAIAFYPYLKTTGKGAFHKQSLRLPIDVLIGSIGILGFSGIVVLLSPQSWLFLLIANGIGGAIALLTGFWFYCQLGGHTGDTYGAVVEWTEALLLCILTALNRT